MAIGATHTFTKAQIQEAVNQAYEEAKQVTGGENAHYIPYLANVDSNLFGLSVCLADGTQFSVGDTHYVFGIESVSKVPTAALVMEQSGAETVRQKIGADATGLPFNSVLAICLENDRPSTPLVNAGAMAACSMVEPQGQAEGKWREIQQNIEALCGSPVEVIDELYRSESATNFQNRSIAWLLKNYGRFYDDVEMSVDLYTRQCSIGVTADQLAIMAATIANGGENPVTQKRVFADKIAGPLTSLITTVGFYQNTGDWLYESGIPAKTGVGGAVLGVMPGLFGVCAFAPPLDDAGNSVRGQAAVKALMRTLDLSIFDARHLSLIND